MLLQFLCLNITELIFRLIWQTNYISSILLSKKIWFLKNLTPVLTNFNQINKIKTFKILNYNIKTLKYQKVK